MLSAHVRHTDVCVHIPSSATERVPDPGTGLAPELAAYLRKTCGTHCGCATGACLLQSRADDERARVPAEQLAEPRAAPTTEH